MDDKQVLKYKDVVLRDSDLDVLRGPCFLNDQIIAFYFNYLSALYDSTDVLLVPPSVSFLLANYEDENLNDFLEPLNLPNKKLVLFTVNDNTDLDGVEAGTHWSLLVYDRANNIFSHHDSMEGVNNFYAMKLYEALKGSMGAPTPPLTKAKIKNNKKKPPAKSECPTPSNAATPPIFVESPTPQQKNGYDCGIYVIAIAKAICHWYSSPRNSKCGDWLSAIQRHVDESVEFTMRDEILKLIQDFQEELN